MHKATCPACDRDLGQHTTQTAADMEVRRHRYSHDGDCPAGQRVMNTAENSRS
jgi:hypothetical protein